MIIFIILALFLITPATQPAVYAMGRSNQAELVCALATIPLSIAAKGYDAKDQKGKAAVMRIIANGLSVANKALFFYNNKKVLGTIAPERDALVNGAIALRDLSKLIQDLRPYLKAKPDGYEDEGLFLDFQYHSTSDVSSDDDVFLASGNGNTFDAAGVPSEDSFFGGDSGAETLNSADAIFSLDDEAIDDVKPEKPKPSQSSITLQDQDPFIFLADTVDTINPENYQTLNPFAWLKTNVRFLLKSSSLPILKGLSAAAMALAQQDRRHYYYYKQQAIVCSAFQLLVQLADEYQDAVPQRYAQKAIAAAMVATVAWLLRELYVLKCVLKAPECGTCMDDIDFDHFCVLECGHYACKTCLSDHTKTADGAFDQCPKTGCTCLIKEKDLEFVYDGQDHAKFLIGRFIRMRNAKGLEKGFEMCPTANCKGTFKTSDTAQNHTCATCNNTYCQHCTRVHEVTVKCEAVFEIENDMTIEEFRQHVNDPKAKRAPCCGILFQKTAGCDHITCRCGAHWCYRCGKFQANTAYPVYNHMNGRGVPQCTSPEGG